MTDTFLIFCRDEKTRTSDLHVPNVARYQLCYIPMALSISDAEASQS